MEAPSCEWAHAPSQLTLPVHQPGGPTEPPSRVHCKGLIQSLLDSELNLIPSPCLWSPGLLQVPSLQHVAGLSGEPRRSGPPHQHNRHSHFPGHSRVLEVCQDPGQVPDLPHIAVCLPRSRWPQRWWAQEGGPRPVLLSPVSAVCTIYTHTSRLTHTLSTHRAYRNLRVHV